MQASSPAQPTGQALVSSLGTVVSPLAEPRPIRTYASGSGIAGAAALPKPPSLAVAPRGFGASPAVVAAAALVPPRSRQQRALAVNRAPAAASSTVSSPSSTTAFPGSRKSPGVKGNLLPPVLQRGSQLGNQTKSVLPPPRLLQQSAKQAAAISAPVSPVAAIASPLDYQAGAEVKSLGLKLRGNPPNPVSILSVTPGSWAAARALRPGFAVVAVNGRSLAMTTPAELQEMLRQRPVRLSVQPVAPASPDRYSGGAAATSAATSPDAGAGAAGRRVLVMPRGRRLG